MWAYTMPVCVLFASSRSDIVFNSSAGAITDHSQSAKNVDLYFKSQLYVEDPGHRKPVLILPNGLSIPGEKAHKEILISAVGGIRTHSLLNDSIITELSPLSAVILIICYSLYLQFWLFALIVSLQIL